MKVDRAWKRNGAKVIDTAQKIANQFKIDYSFELEAQNVFYHNFKKYYKNDEEYMRFMYKSLYNRAKNFYLNKKRNRKNVSEIVSEDGVSKPVYDFIPTARFNPESEMIIGEIASVVKTHLDETEYYVYQQIIEGWEDRDIAEILECHKDCITAIRDKIKSIISFALGETCQQYSY